MSTIDFQSQHQSRNTGKPPRIVDEVLHLFARHRWPCNLRPLAGLLRTAAIMDGTDDIGLRHLPDDFLDDIPDAVKGSGGTRNAESPAATHLDDLALGAILQALAAHGGNVSATARALGISCNTIYRKLPHLKPS